MFMGAALGVSAMSGVAIPAQADTNITYRQVWETGGRGPIANSGVTAVYGVDDSRTPETIAGQALRGDFGDYDGEGAFEVTHTLDSNLSHIFVVYIGSDFKVGAVLNKDGSVTVITCVINNGVQTCTSETHPA
ncbi:hypothetical protein GCM10022235_85490 [Kribbella ginsengisoli]|uniref:Uncharacterized protein n=2 Tax=Kribbella ginsengisoli TaxID=363865 RepID=A0ABP6Z726_9ACTN